MKNQNNKYKIQGTIYDIKFDEITGRKDPTQTYRKYLITLEVTSSEERSGKDGTKFSTKTELPQFEAFNPGYDMDQFKIGDLVDIYFYMAGMEFTYKKGDKAGQKGIMSRSPITFIKHAVLDVQTDGKVDMTASSDINELNKPIDKVFVPPALDDEDELSDLPFILTIPIALGILSQFLI